MSKKPLVQKAFLSTDPAAAYAHFEPLANAYDAEDVPVRSGDVALAKHNVGVGTQAIAPRVDDILEKMPRVDTDELLELPAVAAALLFADGRVPIASSAGTIDATLREVAPLREHTLSYLEIVEALDLISAGVAGAIRAGNGKFDVARDCVDIAGAFTTYAPALEGKHPFTSEQLGDLATKGAWLVQNLTPKGAAKATVTRHPAALMRDRFWKLLDDRYDVLRTVGVALWGIKRVDEHVPALQSRVRATQAKKAPPPAVPAKTEPA